ncbi:ATP-dependent RNA helicase DDX24 [Amia ocellicauda]|uniref:ATP-dependent RNA helicase DDX24 n=1 Tax=Amia ocellicauda TaxID=2972642 RepID=UPI0034645CF1
MKFKRSNKKVFRTPFKPKRGIHVKGNWTPVELDPSLFSEEDMGGIVCFEELTDYKLVDSTLPEENKKATCAVDKKAKKRKAGAEADWEEKKDQEQTDEPSTPPAKKKKKKKKKNQIQQIESAEDTGIGSEVGEEEGEILQEEPQEVGVCLEEESTQEPKIPLKEQKKKKKKQKKNTTQAQEADPPKTKKKSRNWTSSVSSSQEADVSAWKDLFVPEPVLQALSSLGFKAPTPIQALALPPAIRDHMDILGAAETGSGKTLAFGIPMIHSILEWRKVHEEMLSGQVEARKEQQGIRLSAPSDNTEEPSESASDEDPEEEGRVEEVEEEEEEEDDEEEISDTQMMGCVKVIEDIEFDFDTHEKTKSKAKHNPNSPLLGLVLTPTRELAVQVKHHIDAVAQFTGIKTAIIVGGMAPQKQARMLNRRPEIVIATPGRLWELIKERHPHLLNLKKLRCLVIDEADRMVEKGHFAELENLLEMLNDSQFNPKRQNFVFSATLTLVHQTPSRILQKKRGKRMNTQSKLEALMEKVGIKAKPKVIDLSRKQATVESLTETRIHCDADEKDFYLYYFLNQYSGRTMVFANSIDCIKRLNSLLTILDCNPLPLHANMHQKQRLKNLERFAERDNCILLTTDVAARGLDIPDVQHVIHYQVPRTSETYVHRSGRTARAAKEGLSLLLIGPDDMMNFKKIYRTLEKDEELPMFPIQTKCMASIKERVNLARKIEKIEFHNSKAKHHNSWFQQAAEALEVDLDDDVLIGGKRDENEDREQQNMVKSMKKHLKYLITQPIFKTMMKTKYPTQMGKLQVPELPVNTETALCTVNSQKQKQEQKNKPQKNKQKKKAVVAKIGI